MRIVCDIGGTYARFGLEDDGRVIKVRKYKARDFTTLNDALLKYCRDEDVAYASDTMNALLIATAAYEDATVWRFVNQNKWVIDRSTLCEQGWDVEMILNDFAAATWGIIRLKADEKMILKPGVSSHHPCCLLGPGTGLGLGYLIPTMDNQYHVQHTHGGHMLATADTQQQFEILNIIRSIKNDQSAVVFENLVSGSGLYNIYHSLSLINNMSIDANNIEDMLKHPDKPLIGDSISLFHQFFALFARTAVVTGHAYGGLYLTGGVLDIFIEKELFNIEQFKKYFMLAGVDVVNESLQSTPIIYVDNPYMALHGLLNVDGAAQSGKEARCA